MKNISYFFILLLTSCSLFQPKDNRLKIIHWNIKELDTKKIQKADDQMKAVESILSGFDYDVLSIQEMQYDLQGIPNKYYKTTGQNAETFLKILGKDPLDHAISFYPSNTGINATKSKDGYYTSLTRETRKLADQDNYGLFPAQFSTAVISKFPIKEELIIKKLPWIDFNKAIKLSKYRRQNGDKFSKKLQLFDKGFSDNIIEINGREVHLISLHAVPAFHFGNTKTSNFDRNRDQIRFLEWYLTGGTDIPVSLPAKYDSIKPLKPTDSFIVFGNFNASIYDNHEGSIVLRRLFKTVKLWMEKPSHTFEEGHYSLERKKLTLDYIAYNGVELVDAGIYHPDDYNGVCVKYKDIPRQMKARKEVIKEDKCISEKSIELKTASDHFPIWAEFKVN